MTGLHWTDAAQQPPDRESEIGRRRADFEPPAFNMDALPDDQLVDPGSAAAQLYAMPVDQLYYTWAEKGLEGLGRFQIVASTPSIGQIIESQVSCA